MLKVEYFKCYLKRKNGVLYIQVMSNYPVVGIKKFINKDKDTRITKINHANLEDEFIDMGIIHFKVVTGEISHVHSWQADS